jgi:hypothetical protein
MMANVRIEKPESKPETKKSPERLTVSYLDVICIAAAAAILTVSVYDRYFANKVVTADLSGFVRQQKDLLTHGDIQTTDVAARLDEFWKFLHRQPKNLTIINKDTVLANGTELLFAPSQE